MNRYLLDTVTLSELRKKNNAAQPVLDWQYAAQGRQAYVSVITMNEIWYGRLKIEARDPAFAQRLEIWYEEILKAPKLYRQLPVTQEIAKQAAEYRANHNVSANDSLIAATAKIHGLTLATRNTADFIALGISVVNPWEYQG